MRLLQVDENGEFSLTKDYVNDIPPYAILSHTWGDDEEEVTFKDLKKGSGKKKSGYKKIQFCGAQASRDGLQYFWVDTCCINKSNSTELSEAIISMFRWYKDAARCYVYLSDVLVVDLDPIDESLQLWKQAFRNSRWFTRGWTLQELIAPPSVEFFCSHGRRLGNKKELEQQLVEITGIPASALRGTHLSEFPVNERMSWAKTRTTHRAEDKVYSLSGIFGIYMPPLYGEGWESADIRMRKLIGEPPPPTPSGKHITSFH
ncbi:heterokaryon incompatibility protein-domain-containing protein [Hyaloscypha finlandica]|nr:heterokaryon incompatibility protein-domain-containing protein [Hyaloscypha finlandica]